MTFYTYDMACLASDSEWQWIVGLQPFVQASHRRIFFPTISDSPMFIIQVSLRGYASLTFILESKN